MLVIYSWTYDLACSIVDKPSETLLEKDNFSFVSEYQLQAVSWLDVGPMSISPFQHWDPVWLEPTSPSCHSLCELTCVSDPLCLEDTVSLESSITWGSYNVSS